MKVTSTMIPLCIMLLSLNNYAQVKARFGDKVGGGGDASEIRINEIRSDILQWINNGGSQDLDFGTQMTQKEYNEGMTQILQPKAVVLSFVEKDSDEDEDLMVAVEGKPKTCRGFIAKRDGMPTILCNIGRFEATKDSEQYKLIHHEYAGLAGIEKNEGAASDYFLSSQITDYLVPQTILKLAVKRKIHVVEKVDPATKNQAEMILAYLSDEKLNLKIRYGVMKATKPGTLNLLQDNLTTLSKDVKCEVVNGSLVAMVELKSVYENTQAKVMLGHMKSKNLSFNLTTLCQAGVPAKVIINNKNVYEDGKIVLKKFPHDGNFACSEAYESKLTMIERNRFFRYVGDGAIITTGMAGTILLLWPATLPMMTVIPTVVTGLDKEEDLMEAALFLTKTVHVSAHELKELNRMNTVNQTVARINESRKEASLPLMSEIEIQEVSQKVPATKRTRTFIDDIMARANLEGTDVNYEMIRSKILKARKEGNTFCPGQRPLTLNAIKKMMAKK